MRIPQAASEGVSEMPLSLDRPTQGRAYNPDKAPRARADRTGPDRGAGRAGDAGVGRHPGRSEVKRWRKD